MEHKRKIYYDDLKDNTAFKHCNDVMSRLILKYESDILTKLGCKEMPNTHCKETGIVL